MQYIAGAFMGVLIWWPDQDAKLPPEEVDGIFRHLVMDGLAVELGPWAQAKAKKSPTPELDARLSLQSIVRMGF